MMIGEDTERVDADAAGPTAPALEVGGIYQAIGPAPDSKLGPAPLVEVLEELDTGWRTRPLAGQRHASTFIHRRGAGNWHRLENALELARAGL